MAYTIFPKSTGSGSVSEWMSTSYPSMFKNCGKHYTHNDFHNNLNAYK